MNPNRNPNMDPYMHGVPQPQIGIDDLRADDPSLQPGAPPSMIQPQYSTQPQRSGLMGPPPQVQQQMPHPQMGYAGFGASDPMMQPITLSQRIATAMGVPPQPQAASGVDSIATARSLMPPLRESLFQMYRTAADQLQQNLMNDLGQATPSNLPPQFHQHYQDFESICDQLEQHLQTAMQGMAQASSAEQYLPGAVSVAPQHPYMQNNPNRPMTYQAFLDTVGAHVQSTQNLSDILTSAAQDISPTNAEQFQPDLAQYEVQSDSAQIVTSTDSARNTAESEPAEDVPAQIVYQADSQQSP